MTPSATYPDFGHKACELKKYIEASGIFSILLINDKIVHHTPAHVDEFRDWLSCHKVASIIKQESGT